MCYVKKEINCSIKGDRDGTINLSTVLFQQFLKQACEMYGY